MKCKYLKQKLNRKLECKLDKNKIIPKDCANCTLKEYKCTVKSNSLCKRTKKQDKLERNRYSLFTKDLTRCIICGKNKDHLHEVFFGKNRLNSIKYDFVIPLCQEHHTGSDGIHFNKSLDLHYKQLCQKKFEELYGNREDFIKIFGRSYI